MKRVLAVVLVALLSACRSLPLHEPTFTDVVGTYQPAMEHTYVLMIGSDQTFEFVPVEHAMTRAWFLRPGTVRMSDGLLRFYTPQRHLDTDAEQLFRVHRAGAQLCLVPLDGNSGPWRVKLWRVGPPQTYWELRKARSRQ